jgi:hypothetical protein
MRAALIYFHARERRDRVITDGLDTLEQHTSPLDRPEYRHYGHAGTHNPFERQKPQ